jgi:hypothetical protein
MPLLIDEITGSTKPCTVSYTPDGAEKPREWGILYYPEAVTGAVFVHLLEVQQLGDVLKGAQENPAGALQSLKEIVSGLAETLGSLVAWQDLVDKAGANIPPTPAFFQDKRFEFQLAYASAILGDKQRPTERSESSLPSGSTQEASSVAAPAGTSSSEPPSTSASSPGS